MCLEALSQGDSHYKHVVNIKTFEAATVLLVHCVQRQWDDWQSWLHAIHHQTLTHYEWPDTVAGQACGRCPPPSPWACGPLPWTGWGWGFSAVWGGKGCCLATREVLPWSTQWSCWPHHLVFFLHFLMERGNINIWNYQSLAIILWVPDTPPSPTPQISSFLSRISFWGIFLMGLRTVGETEGI